jgi:hypothetical protein
MIPSKRRQSVNLSAAAAQRIEHAHRLGPRDAELGPDELLQRGALPRHACVPVLENQIIVFGQSVVELRRVSRPTIPRGVHPFPCEWRRA